MKTKSNMTVKDKPKELDWEKEFSRKYYDIFAAWKKQGYVLDLENNLKDFIKQTLTQQRTELENQKVKVVWNDVCEQIKQEARTELLEEIKKIVETAKNKADEGKNIANDMISGYIKLNSDI